MSITQLNQFSDEFSLVGYNSTALFDNLGTLKFMLLYFIVLAAFLVLGKIMLKCLKPHSKAAKRISAIVSNLNIMQLISSFLMQSFFDFCMMLFMYYRVSPLPDGGTFSTLPMLKAGDKFAKYFSFFLSGCIAAFYVYCIWFFALGFKRLQELRQLEILLENKPEITNVYSEVLGLEKTRFNARLVDELMFPKRSKILLVKKRKKVESKEKKEEAKPEEPIEVPISMWKRTTPAMTLFEKEFPEF